MSSERSTGDLEDPGQSTIPTISRKTREKSKSQDTYRRMLAASYDAQIGELPADKIIEDIFAGGDGLGKGNEGGKNANMWGSTRTNNPNDDDDKSSVRTYTPKSPGRRREPTRSRAPVWEAISGGRIRQYRMRK